MSLLLNMLSRLVITFLPRSKRLLISWLQSPSAVILYSLLIYPSTYGLLGCPSLLVTWTMLLWTWVYKYLFKTLLSSLLNAHPESGFPNHTISIFNILSNHRNVFIMVAQWSRVSVSPHHCQHLLFSLFFKKKNNKKHLNECEVTCRLTLKWKFPLEWGVIWNFHSFW